MVARAANAKGSGVTQNATVPKKWAWFPESRYGLFIHWGPYAAYGRGEQVLFREHLDPREYEQRACTWAPTHFDPRLWAETARCAGFRYAVLTTRHHDGYCLWDTATTNYSSAQQAPQQDFVGAYISAFRAEGLRIGLYYSLIDWRIPAWFEGPDVDPEGWTRMRNYIHAQVEELLTNYGQIDLFWFDGVWPRTREELQADVLVRRMRDLQPHLLINNRLGGPDSGDLGTPEHTIKAEDRLWESCQVSTWRLWGHTIGERWRPAGRLLDMLCECASKGGNLLLNVGPQADGQFPPEFATRALEIGRWLEIHGEAVYGTDGGDVTEFVTRGWQTTRGNSLYLIFRFWDGRPSIRVADLVTPVERVELLTTGQALPFDQTEDELLIREVPRLAPTPLFPVIKVVCQSRPAANQWGRERLWGGDPRRVAAWARRRGESTDAHKQGQH
jgi:alpha-L-fucosidase